MMLRPHSLRFHLTATFALTAFVIKISYSINVPSVPADILKSEIIREVNDRFTITKVDKNYFSKMNSDDRLVDVEPITNGEDLRIVEGTEAKLGKTQ